MRNHVPAQSVEEQWDIDGLEKTLREEWQLDLPLKAEVEAAQSMDDDDIVAKVKAAADAAFEAKLERIGEEQFTPFMRMILLQSIDQHWREHLAALDYLRQGIHLRGYAQKNPKQEYKREAFELFSQLLDLVKMDVTRALMLVRVQSQEEVDAAAAAMESRAEQISNITYTHPQEDGSVAQEDEQGAALGAGAVGGGRCRRPGRAGAQGRPQRSVPVRQRQEVQAVPRPAGVRVT